MKWNPLRRAYAFVRRNKQGEETVAIAVALDVIWQLIVGAGLFTAGVAAAATFSTAAYHPSFSFSTKGAAMTARYEGLRLSPYNDPYNCTVGVGHLIHMGVCSSADYSRWRITYGQAMAMLIHDSGGAAACIRSRITHPIAQYQFDALVDLTFNAGCGSLDYSGIANEINRGDLAAVSSTLPHTAVTASGHYLAGLYTRRLGEATLWRTGFYGSGIGSYLPPAKPKPLRVSCRRGIGTEWPHRPLTAYRFRHWICKVGR